jgi:hypothetical protein
MARVVRQIGRALWVLVPLAVLGFVLLAPPGGVEAAYSGPLGKHGSGTVAECVCHRPPARTSEGVRLLEGALQIVFPLMTSPGLVGTHAYSPPFDPGVSGESRMGRGVLSTCQQTMKTLDSPTADCDRPDGRMVP